MLQGNYDESLASGRTDCGCGYTDPRDNHFARDQLRVHVRAHLGRATAPGWARCRATGGCSLGEHRVLMCHGSPRVINEFLWESSTPTGLLRHLLREGEADVLLCTHTGIKWHRALGRRRPRGERRA